MTDVKNKLEAKIDQRLSQLIKESYGRSDGGFDRARYQRLMSDRYTGRLDGLENIGIQNAEYFDQEDPVYKNIMDHHDTRDYANAAHSHSKNIERLKKMDAGRNDDLDGVRDDIRDYLGKVFTGETAYPGDVKQDTSVPELFVKERVLNNETDAPRLVNVADLVNHIHYKVMVERKIPTDSQNNQYSYQNINNINKAARERLAPYVRAFLATYEMTPQMIRRVYASKDHNLDGKGIDRPDPALRGSAANLVENFDNGALAFPLIAAGVGGVGGMKGGKKKRSGKKKKSKKSKKGRK